MANELEKIADDLMTHVRTLSKGNVIGIINADTIAAIAAIAGRIRASLPAAEVVPDALATMEALVNLVEGYPVIRWRTDKHRLKDQVEWVAFYNMVASIKRSTPPHPAAGSGKDVVTHELEPTSVVTHVLAPHDMDVVKELKAMADDSSGFWNRATAAGALRIIRSLAGAANPAAPPGVDVVPYRVARTLLGDAYNAGAHGIGYSQQIMELQDAITTQQPSAKTRRLVGLVLVPREPTAEMVEVLSNVGYRHGFRAAYTAMLAAAASQQPDQEARSV